MPSNEAARLRRLHDLNLLHAASEEILDGFVQLASACTGLPIALISLVDADRQWIKSAVGLPADVQLPGDWPRSASLCAHAICHPDAVFEVEDARQDPRFAGNPSVRGSVGVVHYAGAALVMPSGEAVGVLCVANTCPGRLAEPQRRTLLGLAQQIVRLLLLRERGDSLEREKLLQDAVDVDLADLAPCGMYAMDAEGVVLRANEHWARMLGASGADELLGTGWMRHVHEDDLDQVLETRRSGLANEHGYTYSFRSRPDGSGAVRWLRSRVRPVDARLAPIAFVGVAVDETHRRDTEEELRRRSRLLETILQHLPCGVTVLDADSTPVLSNEAARELLEDPAASFEVSTPEFLPLARRLAASADLRSLQAPAPQTHARTGPVAVVHGASLPGGWAVTTFTDVTAAREAARDLQASEERLERAIEAADITLWELDLPQERCFLSAATAALLGMPGVQTELPLPEFMDRLIPQAKLALAKAYRDLRRGSQERARFRYPVLLPDGSSRWILSYAKVSQRAPDGSPQAIVGTCKDVTETVRAEDHLQAAVEAADRANRAKSEFLATMSHEIRTPLNGVVGLAQLLSEADLPPLERKSVDLLRGCAKTLLGVVNNILDFSKIEAGHLALEEVPTDLPGLVQEMDNIARARAAEKGIAFELEAAPGLPQWITADPIRLRQVLLNLLGNALKFTEHGAVRLRVASVAAPEGDRLTFAVADTGIGIPESAREQLFTRFTQVDASTTRRFGGTGLGLAICRDLVQLMGGDIAVESREGEGSTFTVDLPLRPAAAPAQARSSSAGAVRPDAKILVAEDNEVNQHVIDRMLRRQGYRDVTIVADGEQAVRACGEGSFDLILMDCQMPALDGRDATRKLRASGLRTPVIALTATATDRDREECLQAGMDDYLTKPIELPVLAEKVQRWLGSARSVTEASAVAEAEVLAAFNKEALERYFFGDAAFFGEARALFLRSSREALEQLGDAVRAHDEDAARRICHRIKASAATLGADLLAELCRRYEAGEVLAPAAPSWLGDATRAFDAFDRESEGAAASAAA